MSLVSLGFGNVGQILCQRAIQSGLKSICVADSSAALLSKNNGFSVKKLNDIINHKQTRKLSSIQPNISTEDIIPMNELSLINLPKDAIIVDCTASNNTTKFLMDIQSKNIPIILANKRPLTGPYSDFVDLTKDYNLIRFESTVCAGIPTINPIQRFINSNDNIIEIEGQFSGSLGYIFTELQNGKSFSDTIINAMNMGYTEPDPRDDLNGIDVARKALIIARCIGINAEMSDIDIESIYPSEMDNITLHDFMKDITLLDDIIKDRINCAHKYNKKLRYVGYISKDKIKVGLKEVDINNPLYSLIGTANLISINSKYLNGLPLVITGPGGGSNITVSSLISDIVDIVRFSNLTINIYLD